jgi:hypothetical protein
MGHAKKELASGAWKVMSYGSPLLVLTLWAAAALVGLLAWLLRVVIFSLVQRFSLSASEDLGRDWREAEGAGVPQWGALGVEGPPLKLSEDGGLERALWQA